MKKHLVDHPHIASDLSRFRRKAAFVAVAACFSANLALANPTAPTVVHGTASFNQAGSILNITNSHNAIINWGSFSIGVNELTRFIQPSALSAVLNRVVGQDPSAILGALQSNGRVFLLNPNGIVFGAGAQINVAGLVASTLKLSNEDFLNNRLNFTDGAGAGSVINQGAISATGGPVYLVGNAVTNQGIITSPQGEIVLAAGNSVELVNPGTPNLRVEIVAPDNEARNLGSITADAGRIGIYAGLIKQGGLISADSAVAEGGRILLKSTKRTDLEAGSVTSARGTGGGEILALSDMTSGTTTVAGKLDASANTSGAPGKGGFIETSAASVKVTDSASVSAAASAGGERGTWLIDPNDYYIAAYGSPIVDITGAILSSTLNGAYGGTNIDIISSYGGTPGTGTIFVNDTVSWSNTSVLRLIAEGGIDVNSAISNSAAGGVRLYAGWNGGFDGGGAPTVGLNPAGVINIGAPINTGGNIHLVASNNIGQSASGTLTASGLLAMGNDGFVNLASATNAVGTIAGSAVGQFAFSNSGPLTVGSVDGVSGITVSGVNPGLDATLDIAVTGGQLTVNTPIMVVGIEGGAGSPGGNATVNLSSNGGIAVNANVTAMAGHGGSGEFSISPGLGGNAAINMTNSGAAADLVINTAAMVEAIGGGGGDGYLIDSARGGDGMVNLTSAGGITVEGGLKSQGGHGGSGSSANGGRGGDGTVNISAAGAITVSGVSANRIWANGGFGGSGAWGGNGGRGGDAAINVSPGGLLTVGNSTYYYQETLLAQAGGGGYAYGEGDAGSGGAGGDGKIQVSSAGGINIYGGLSARGGQGGFGSSGGGNGNGGHGILTLNNNSLSNSLQSFFGGEIFADGGQGRVGGNATITIFSAGGIDLQGNVYADGGYGFGNSGGGAAYGGKASLSLQNTSASAPLTIGGWVETSGGGTGSYYGGTPGVGGDAELIMTSAGGIAINGGSVSSYGGYGEYGGNGGTASVRLTATNGSAMLIDGGEVYAQGGYSYSYGGSAQGNGGSATVALTNTSSSSPILIYGYVYAGGGEGATGGNAAIIVDSAGGIEVNGGYVGANGGYGYFYGGSEVVGSAQGGTGSVVMTNTSSSADISLSNNASVYATGGGTSSTAGVGNGGDAVLILSSAGGIAVSDSRVGSQGGYGYSGGQGGAAGTTLLAGGNIQIEGGEGAAWGGSGGAGGNAALTVVSGGNITVDNASGWSYDNLVAYSSGGGVSSVVVSAAGNLDLTGGADVYTDGVAGLGGASITLDSSRVWGGTGVTANASGGLNVVNDSSLASGGAANITTGGNVLVENNSMIAGYPDVVMKVGGEIFMNTGGRIEAGLPTTIYLTFPMLASGGFSVNGVPGVVFDGSTGFFADGSGAVLGTNLLVTYGGGTAIEIPTNVLIVSMNESITPPDPERDKDIFEDEQDMKKKNAPVCR